MKILSATLAAAALAGCAAALYLNRSKEEELAECSCGACKSLPEDFTVTAHTGCMGTQPNSIASIRAAAENGADIVEVDLRFNGKGEAVLCHNPVTRGVIYVTLEEAFKVVSEYDRLRVNVDVKETKGIEQVQLLAEKYGLLERVFMTGVRTNFVSAVRAGCPRVPYYLNVDTIKPLTDNKKYIDRLIKKLESTGAIGINISKAFVTPGFVKRVQQAGYPVSIWTPSDEKELKRCLAMRPDNITTREPALLCKLLNR